jgi:hypothetical protein
LTVIRRRLANKDGRGFNITYDALPLTGRIVMRRITKRPGKRLMTSHAAPARQRRFTGYTTPCVLMRGQIARIERIAERT